MSPRQLVSWDGRLSRRDFLLWGLILFAIKYNLDRFAISRWMFSRTFEPLLYFNPMDRTVLDRAFADAPVEYGLVLLAASLPFAAAGVGLAIQRLRDVGAPRWAAALFFFPYVNLLLFAILGVLPGREVDPRAVSDSPLRRWLPKSAVGSALASVLVTVPCSLALAFASIQVFGAYALGIFVGLPFVMGLAAAALYAAPEPRGLGACVGVALLTVAIAGAALLAIAVEGIVCLAMAAPIALAFAALGGAVGWMLSKGARSPAQAAYGLAAFPLLGLLMGAESAILPPTSSEREVGTVVEIGAPPDVVWRNVVEFSELPPPDDWLFRTGVAYPLRAQIEGRGVGAMRRCVFSTGAFLEPIRVWDEPRELAFGVSAQPEAMNEWSPWPRVAARHLNGYLTIRRGQFLLTALPGGRTRLEGRTWYAQNLWPTAYWERWSDWIIHRIHRRVLDHIRRLSESR